MEVVMNPLHVYHCCDVESMLVSVKWSMFKYVAQPVAQTYIVEDYNSYGEV